MKPRVLLVNCPNRLGRPPEFFPYGIAILAKVLKEKNIQVQIYDLNLNRNLSLFFHFLERNNSWDIIGLSGLITTYSYQKDLSAQIRKIIPHTLIISGGGLATSVPELLLQKTAIEVACLGEGESTLPELVSAWFDSKNLEGIKGIYWKNRDTGEITFNGYRPLIRELDSIPFPDWEAAHFQEYLKNFSAFYNKGIQGRQLRRRGDLTTTRGCPFHCSFCFNIFDRHRLRSRSIENVIEEIKVLRKNYGIDSIDFLDEFFTYSNDRTQDLCDSLLKLGFEVKWGSATRTDAVDKDLLNLMKRSGSIFLLYGFESGSQKILNKMGKKLNVHDSWEKFVMTEETGIDARGNLIIGHPGENLTTIRDSRDFQKKRHDFLLQKYGDKLPESELSIEMKRRFETVSFVVPYPGTQLYDQNKEKIGDLESFLIKISMSDAKKFVINLSDISTNKLITYQRLLSNPSLWGKI